MAPAMRRDAPPKDRWLEEAEYMEGPADATARPAEWAGGGTHNTQSGSSGSALRRPYFDDEMRSSSTPGLPLDFDAAFEEMLESDGGMLVRGRGSTRALTVGQDGGESGLSFLESAGDTLNLIGETSGQFLPDLDDMVVIDAELPRGEPSRPTSQRRPYEAISKTTRQQSPPSSGRTSGSDERHVDVKPRLGGGTSSSEEQSQGYRDSDESSDEHLSRSPPGERDGGEANNSSSDRSGEDAARGHSPLSKALTFLYSAAPPKVMLRSSDASGSQSGSDNSQQGGHPSRPYTQRRRPIMSDSNIMARIRSGASSGEANVASQRQATRKGAQHPADIDVESYSDVEFSGTSRQARRRAGPGQSAPLDATADALPMWGATPMASEEKPIMSLRAEAKEPSFEGPEAKRLDEAKETAESMLIDALNKHEAKLLLPEPDTSFFAPFVVAYRAFDSGQVPGLGVLVDFKPIRTITRYGASFALEETRSAAIPQLPPTHVFHQATPDDGDATMRELLPHSPESTTTAASAIGTKAVDGGDAMLVAQDVVDSEVCNDELLSLRPAARRSHVVEALQQRAGRGVVVLGGRGVPVQPLSAAQAMKLVSANERGLASDDVEDAEIDAQHDDLSELLAQKTARKPPRRSARPLAPAGVKLTADERVALERERNREHARNTRLRKKAALANLKETVEKLSMRCERADRDNLEKRARGAVKRTCIETFFRHRARAETDGAKWAEVVTDDVELWQPVTPHRSYRPSEVKNTRRLSRGVPALIEDAASLAVLFRSLGRRGPNAKTVDRAPRFVFEATIASRDQSEEAIEEAFATSDVIGMHWSMRTLDGAEFGLSREISKNGMLVAGFDSSSCKVKYVEFVFDVDSFASQIQRTLGLASPPVVRNTIVMDDKSFYADNEACVLTTPTRPHVISDVNKAWLNLCAVGDKSECIGHTLSMIQGEHTDKQRISDLLEHVANQRAADCVLVNYRVSGEPFLNYLRVFPLYRDRDPSGKPYQYLGILKDIINDNQSLPDTTFTKPAAVAGAALSAQTAGQSLREQHVPGLTVDDRSDASRRMLVSPTPDLGEIQGAAGAIPGIEHERAWPFVDATHLQQAQQADAPPVLRRSHIPHIHPSASQHPAWMTTAAGPQRPLNKPPR